MNAKISWANGRFVRLETSAGSMLGLWHESERVPPMGALVSIELDIEYQLCGTDITDMRSVEISTTGNMTSIRGMMESVDEDQTGFLRLGSDSLTLIETDGTLGPGDFVSFAIASEKLQFFGGEVSPAHPAEVRGFVTLKTKKQQR